MYYITHLSGYQLVFREFSKKVMPILVFSRYFFCNDFHYIYQPLADCLKTSGLRTNIYFLIVTKYCTKITNLNKMMLKLEV